MTNTIATAAVQLEVEDAQRGRLMALWSVSFLGTRPFGSLVDGGVAEAAGLRAAGVVMSAPVLVAGAALVWSGRRSAGKRGDRMRPASLATGPAVASEVD
jgi:hypothetical protein